MNLAFDKVIFLGKDDKFFWHSNVASLFLLAGFHSKKNGNLAGGGLVNHNSANKIFWRMKENFQNLTKKTASSSKMLFFEKVVKNSWIANLNFFFSYSEKWVFVSPWTSLWCSETRFSISRLVQGLCRIAVEKFLRWIGKRHLSDSMISI